MKLLFALLMMMCTLPASAQMAVVGKRGEKVPAMKVADVVMKEGETEQEFLLRSAIWLRNFTATSGYEACSNICRSPDGQKGLRVITSNSQMGCAVIDVCPENMSMTTENIHSHPVSYRLNLNPNDRVLLMARGTSMKKPDVRIFNNRNPDVFSKEDFQAGSGYLVTRTKVWYQNGLGTEKIIMDLPPLSDPSLSP